MKNLCKSALNSPSTSLQFISIEVVQNANIVNIHVLGESWTYHIRLVQPDVEVGSNPIVEADPELQGVHGWNR